MRAIMKREQCPFCNIEIENRTVFQTLLTRAIVAKHAVRAGQALIIPKRHVARLEHLSSDELAELISSCASMSQLLLKVYQIDGFNIVLNEGEAAGQTVSHLHFHVIPRVLGDIRVPNHWLSEELFERLNPVSDPEMERTVLQLRKAIDDFSAPSKEAKNLELSKPKDAFVSPNARILSYTKIGHKCFIEEDVILGHPPSNAALLLNDSDFFSKECEVIIGDNSVIRSGTIIYMGTKIGEYFDCGHNVLIRDNVQIGQNVYIYPSSQVHSNVSIGKNCRISGWIGNRSIIEDNVSMFGNLIHKYEQKIGGITEQAPIIKSGAVIGWNAVVIGGVVIGEGATVGAGSVVTKNVSPGAIIAGNPARPLDKGI